MHVVHDDTVFERDEASSAAARPSLCLFLTEPARSALSMSVLPWATPWLAMAPRGKAQGVLVLPGLMASDTSTIAMRGFLTYLGYDVHGWELGRNVGPTDVILDGMPRLLRQLARRTGAPVSVVGWSLGGVYARELAREQPGAVRQVITIGSPFALRDPRQSRADGAFQRQSYRHAASRVPSRQQIAAPIAVPSTAIYSKRDGIVAWQACVAPPSPSHQNIEVSCAHLAFGVDPATLWAVADRLAQPGPASVPFSPPRFLKRLYPEGS